MTCKHKSSFKDSLELGNKFLGQHFDMMSKQSPYLSYVYGPKVNTPPCGIVCQGRSLCNWPFVLTTEIL
ncbi:hypothetical protein CEXT_50161, partial [Caerostris extrusa]